MKRRKKKENTYSQTALLEKTELRDNLDQAPVSRNWGSELDAEVSSTSSTRPQLEVVVLNGLFP
jgi:hypothetical protein